MRQITKSHSDPSLRRILCIAALATGLVLMVATDAYGQNKGRGKGSRTTNTKSVEKKPKRPSEIIRGRPQSTEKRSDPRRPSEIIRSRPSQPAKKVAPNTTKRKAQPQSREQRGRNASPPAREKSGKVRENKSRPASNNRAPETRQQESSESSQGPVRAYERGGNRTTDRSGDRPTHWNDDGRRYNEPQHWDRDRRRDQREHESGFGIHLDFDHWDLDIHFGDPRRGYWYRDCRPHHRCGRSRCRFCHPPRHRYRYDCRPGHRCGYSSCHFCYPPRIFYRPICRVGARCGLIICDDCRPPIIIRYDTGYFERTLRHGWDEIAYCEYRDARDTFECLIDLNECDPRPRIGLSIAQGLRGRESTAAREMRRAVDLNPGALGSVPRYEDVECKIVELLYEFEDRVRDDCDDEDDLFMVASLRTILGDYNGALRAIRRGIYYGDCSSEARKLRDFLACRTDDYRYGW